MIAVHPRRKPVVSAEPRIDILLLGDDWDSQAAFLAACEAMARNLFDRMEPFHSLQNRINIFSAWEPHPSFQVTPGVSKPHDRTMDFGAPEQVWDMIGRVQNAGVPPTSTQSQIWLDPASRSYALVGVLVQQKISSEAGGCFFLPTYFQQFPELAFFTLYVNEPPESDFTVFVHELCHALGLADEYVDPENLDKYPTPWVTGQHTEPNVIAKEEFTTSNAVVVALTDAQINSLRWRKLMTARDIAALKSGASVETHDKVIPVRDDINGIRLRELVGGVLAPVRRVTVPVGNYDPPLLCQAVEAALNASGGQYSYTVLLDGSNICTISADGPFTFEVYNPVGGAANTDPVDWAIIALALLRTDWAENPPANTQFVGDGPVYDGNQNVVSFVRSDSLDTSSQRVGLVEGAGQFPYRLYRSTQDCIMSNGTSRLYRKDWRFPRLCKVCTAHLFKRITGQEPGFIAGNLDLYSRPDSP